MAEKRYNIDQIEHIANAVREKFGENGDMLNVVKIANELGFTVYEGTFDDPNIAGKVVSNGDQKAIYINQNDILPRKRFTVAHEIGHIVLHHLLDDTPFEQIDYRGMNRTFDAKEWEANQFAASLLMPKDKSINAWNELRDVDDFAERMGVSKAAAAIRLENLGLI